MKNTKRQAFTIVELVIVIAVIAILSAVLIPTFGAIIKNANIAADEAEAASVTTHLNLNLNGIKSEADINKAIKDAYGEEVASTFAPRSAQYGYHYWYDAMNNRVVLSTYEDLPTETANVPTEKNGAMLMSATTVADTFTPFESASFRSVKGGRYFLIDRSGSEVVELLSKIDSIASADDYTDIADGFSSVTDGLYQEIFTKFAKTAIINDFGMFVCSNDVAIEKIYIPSNATTLGSATYVDGYLVDRSTVSLAGVATDINLPENITVDAFALTGFANVDDTTDTLENTLELHVNTTEDKLGEIFEAYSTDCVIVLPNGARYIVDGTNIYKLPKDSDPVVGDLGFDSLDDSDFSFNISVPGVNTTPGTDQVYYDATNDILYIAYDYTGNVQLNLDQAISLSSLTWECNDDNKSILTFDGGRISLNEKLEIGDNNVFTITGTLKNSTKSDTITVWLLRPTEVSFKLDGKEYSNTSTDGLSIDIMYYANKVFDISDVAVNCPTHVTFENATAGDVTFSTNGSNLFSISEADGKYTLTLNNQDDYSGSQILTVAFGNHISVDFTVTVDNQSNSPFVLNQVQGKNIGHDFLFRVGNANSFELGKLFNATATNEKLEGDITIDVYNYRAAGNTAALIGTNGTGTLVTGTGLEVAITSGATWDKTQFKFTGTGIAKVLLTDKYGRSSYVLLEIIDAENITSIKNVTSNNAVLLNDVTVTDASNDYANIIKIYNNYTLHGNGFTVTLPQDYKYSNNGFVGYIELGSNSGTSGNLDNVKIEGPVYPEVYVFASDALIDPSSASKHTQYFYNSVFIRGGNCTITNSYISGSRTALYTYGGSSIVLENTTLSGGALANMQVDGGSSITFKNVTTYQTPVEDSYEQGTEALGVGIFITNNKTQIYIEDSINQYNWITEDQIETYVPSDYQSVFKSFFDNDNYTYSYNNTDHINFGLIFVDSYVANNLHNETGNGYHAETITIAGEDGTLVSNYGGAGTSGTLESIDAPAYAITGYNPIAPTFNFDNTANNDPDDENDSTDSYCVYENGELNIGIAGTETGKTIDLSNVTVSKNGQNLEIEIYLNGVKVTGTTATINYADGTSQRLTFKATSDAGYNTDGSTKPGSVEYEWSVDVNIAKLSYPAPVWNMNNTYTFSGTSNLVYTYKTTSGGYVESVPIYNGIKVTYYDKDGNVQNLDLSTVTTTPTKSSDNELVFTYTLSGGETLTMTVNNTGWKGNPTSFYFTTYNSKLYIYSSGVGNDTYRRQSVTNQNFNIKITYNFTDSFGRSTGDQQVNWYNAAASNGSVATVQWKTFDSVNGEDSCLTEGTLITMADGTQKPVEDLSVGDMVLAFNHETGKFVATPLIFNSHADELEPRECDVLHLQFSNGEKLEIVESHGLFDMTLMKYVYLDYENYTSYIGHKFYYAGKDGTSSEHITLENAYIETKITRVFCPVTYFNMNSIANGFLNAPNSPYGIAGPVNYFDYDPDLKYNEEKMQADIEKYGLYTYDDFKDYISEEAYNSSTAVYLKVAEGKGLITFEEILIVINYLLEGSLIN